MRRMAWMFMAVLFIGSAGWAQQPTGPTKTKAGVMPRLEAAGEAERGHSFNRAPLQPLTMARLPLGSVRARGWLKHQLDLMTVGMTGRLMEVSKFLAPDNGWFGTEKEGWEEQPYWLRGFYDLAVLTGEERLLAESKRWIDAVLSSQDKDGYFGARYHKCVQG